MSETLKILQMLQEGTISVDEANELLQAVEADDRGNAAEGDSTPHEMVSTSLEQDIPPAVSPNIGPDMKRFRRLCQIPFAIALAVLILSAWGTYMLYRQAEARVTLGFVAVLIVLALAVIATAATLWMTMAPWIHVRIRDEDDKRIAISLPVPLTLARWGLRLAHRFVDDEMAKYLDTAAELVKTTKSSLSASGAEPIVVDIDDGGERVQVYIG